MLHLGLNSGPTGSISPLFGRIAYQLKMLSVLSEALITVSAELCMHTWSSVKYYAGAHQVAKQHDAEVAAEEARLVPLLCFHSHASPGVASAAPSIFQLCIGDSLPVIRMGSQLYIGMCMKLTVIALRADFQRLCAVEHEQGAAGRGNSAGLAEHPAQESGTAILPDIAQYWCHQFSYHRTRTARRAKGLEELPKGWGGH